MVSKVALTITSPSPVFGNLDLKNFLNHLRPVAEFQGIGDVHVEIQEPISVNTNIETELHKRVSLIITSPDHGADLLEDFLESLRPIAEHAALGKVSIEVLEDEQEEQNKLYVVVIEFQGLVEHIQPFRDKKLAEAYFGEKTSVLPWEVYDQTEKGRERLELLGNYAGSRIYEFDDFV